jgi:uncharacterized protein
VTPVAKERALQALAAVPFRPVWWARTGLQQTVAAMRAQHPPPPLRAETWPTPDGDALRVHFVDVADPRAPLVLVLHGLEGSRDSSYVRTAAALTAARGWRFAVLEFRSCGGVLNRARRTYHSGETTDLDFVVRALGERFPGAPLLPLGYSLGGNVLLKWLGEQGARAPAPVVAAAAVSPPFDLGVCSRQCDQRYGGAIARHFLRTLLPKARQKHAQHPGSFDLDALRGCRTFARFDDVVTAPTHGFRDGADYYATQSCGPFLPAIRRPVLLLAAVDDPLCRPEILPHAAVAASPFLLAQFPRGGGHTGFVDGGAPWRPRRWAEAQVLRFFAGQLGPTADISG